MKKSWIFLSLLLIAAVCTLSGCHGQKKMVYTRSNTSGGAICFLVPMVWYQSGNTRIEIDQTIESTEDTVRMGVSFYSKEVVKVNLFSLANTAGSFRQDVKPLFVEKEGKEWICRFFILLPKAEAIEFYSGNAPELCYRGTDNVVKSLKVKEKDWEKIQEGSKEFFLHVQLN
jgi:hypothetical protein